MIAVARNIIVKVKKIAGSERADGLRRRRKKICALGSAAALPGVLNAGQGINLYLRI